VGRLAGDVGLGSAIRELAAARNAPRVAAAFFKRSAQIWDLRTFGRLSEFESVFDFGGGNRIALNPTGESCVAAGWTKGSRGGVACYDALAGSILWHRTDIRHTQFVRFSAGGEIVRCGVDAGRFQELDARTGETVRSFVGIGHVFDSPHSSSLLLDKRRRGYLIRGATDLRVPNLSFGLLDAAFSPDCVCISEAVGPVRCLGSSSGEEQWRYEPPKGAHVLFLSYRATDRPTGTSTPCSGNTNGEHPERSSVFQTSASMRRSANSTHGMRSFAWAATSS
jgi:outer membrane protein assembly factor BamB